jgi:hypothetical protein
MQDYLKEKFHLMRAGNSIHKFKLLGRALFSEADCPNESYREWAIDASDFAKTVKFRNRFRTFTAFWEVQM